MPDKVTAGEWVIEDGYLIAKESGKVIADCDAWIPETEEVANARLMAASKRMYRALRKIKNAVGVRTQWREIWKELNIEKLLEEIDVEVD